MVHQHARTPRCDLPADPELEGRLQIGLARAATLSGDENHARNAAEEAWRTARSSGNRSLEAAAALLYAGEPELNVVGDEPGTLMLAATLRTSLASRAVNGCGSWPASALRCRTPNTNAPFGSRSVRSNSPPRG